LDGHTINGINRHAKVAGVRENLERIHTICRIFLEPVTIGGIGSHGYFLIHNTAALLVCVLMVMSVEEGCHVVVNEQLVNGDSP
jgi:hypothetical protein